MAKTDSEKKINARAIVEEGPAGIVLGAMVAGGLEVCVESI